MKTNNTVNTSPNGDHYQKNPSDEADSCHSHLFQKILEWTLRVENCCKEKPIVSPFGNVSLTCFFVVFVTTMVYNDLPQRTLTLSLIVALKHICLAHREIIRPCPPMKRRNQSISSLRLAWRCFARLKAFSLYFPTASPSLFCLLNLLLPYCFSLSL